MTKIKELQKEIIQLVKSTDGSRSGDEIRLLATKSYLKSLNIQNWKLVTLNRGIEK